MSKTSAIDEQPSACAGLPLISDNPVRLASCCPTLSQEVLSKISLRLPTKPSRTVSIGCGSGLLEALLMKHSDVAIEGIEVTETINQFLPAEAFHTVIGTWQIFSEAHDYDAWMFVYPRSTDLLKKYVESISNNTAPILRIIWIGPVQDWDVFSSCFTSSSRHHAIDPPIWLSPFEILRVITFSSQTGILSGE